MSQKNVLKMLTGASMIARKSGEAIKNSSANYIEKNIIKGQYVTREEYEQLHKLVMKLQKEIEK